MKKVLSLFSGCGGMDLGFEGGFLIPKACLNKEICSDWIEQESNDFITLKKNNFDTVFANDILKPAEIAWKSYFGKRGKHNSIFHTESIIDLVKLYNEGKFAFPKNIDVVTGGFPCQDFSVAGKRQGFNSKKCHNNNSHEESTEENRGKLYMWMREVISIVKPKIFIAENVKGLLSLGDAKDIIESDFSKIDGNGYLIAPIKVLKAQNYGVPQSRERVIFIGLNKKFLKSGIEEKIINGDINLHPEPTHSSDTQNLFDLNGGAKVGFTKTSDVLFDLLEPDLSTDQAQQKYSKAKYCKGSQGQIEIDLNGISPTIRAEHHGNIEYRRLSVDKGGKNKKELDNGCTERRLTVRECARIQTFPDDYDFIIKNNGTRNNLSASGAYKVIGNAVPPLLAYHIARNIEDKWNIIFDC